MCSLAHLCIQEVLIKLEKGQKIVKIKRIFFLFSFYLFYFGLECIRREKKNKYQNA